MVFDFQTVLLGILTISIERLLLIKGLSREISEKKKKKSKYRQCCKHTDLGGEWSRENTMLYDGMFLTSDKGRAKTALRAWEFVSGQAYWWPCKVPH